MGKKLLILGGTQFIGRALVERLVELNQFEITLFNRQQTHSDLFPELEKLKGDRETSDVEQIGCRNWDLVVDLSCYYPDSLLAVLSQIKSLENYLLVSTCSVYDNEENKSELRDEGAAVLSCSSEQRLDRTDASYGNRKAECERILKKSGLPYSIFRPALVFGKYDHTDRLYYWLHQVKTKNHVLLPDKGERLFSTTYVSDLVESIVSTMAKPALNEVFNIITNPKTSIKEIVDVARKNLDSHFETVNTMPQFLYDNSISPWVDMPLWIDGDHFTYSNEKLKETLNIQLTDFESALKHTIEHYDKLNWPKPKYGISEDTRRNLLKKLDNQES